MYQQPQPYGQPQQPYGQPAYQGAPPPQQYDPYGNPQPQPVYNQPPPPQPQYGQPTYGQPGYPQQGVPMGQPDPYGMSLNPMTEKSNANGIDFPARIQCPNCRTSITTNVKTQPGTHTWLCCVIWAICFWPVMCVPFCVDSCKDKIHTCPTCQTQVGIKEYKMC